MRVLEQVRFEVVSLRMSNAAPVEGGRPEQGRSQTLPRSIERLNCVLGIRRMLTKAKVGLEPDVSDVGAPPLLCQSDPIGFQKRCLEKDF